MERYTNIINPELKELLIEFNSNEKLRQEQIDIVKESEEKHNEMMVNRQKIVDKMKSITGELGIELGEFEIITDVTLEDDNDEEVKVKIVDQLEMAKEQLRKKNTEETVA
jgi:hypothetical protein